MSQRVSLNTLGCKTNQFESATMQECLLQAGYTIVPFEDAADLVIVNTCTVTAATDAQSRNIIRRARRLNPDCRVVVTGCYAQIDPDTLRSLPGVSVVLGNDEKQELLRYLNADKETQIVEVSDIRSAEEVISLPISTFAERSRAFVQIQNGCDAFCSYCIIPYARGSSRSLMPAQVIEQVRLLEEKGFQEIVLTGIHIGGYGRDLVPETDLVSLLRRIEAETTVPRVRLGSVEPTEIHDDLIGLMVDSSRICPHLHIPLQSGDNQVLQRMNRHYTAEFFHDLVTKIHRQITDVAIGLDVIAGFPGETGHEFENTCRLIEALPISHLHVFPYSRRPGTPAASSLSQLPGSLIKKRSTVLREIGKKKQKQFAEQFLGREIEVVVEKGNVPGGVRGMTRNYLPVVFKTDFRLHGKCVWIKDLEWRSGGLHGVLM